MSTVSQQNWGGKPKGGVSMGYEPSGGRNFEDSRFCISWKGHFKTMY